MKLEIGNFHVKDVVFGERTFFENGVLTINKKRLVIFILRDEHITEKLTLKLQDQERTSELFL